MEGSPCGVIKINWVVLIDKIKKNMSMSIIIRNHEGKVVASTMCSSKPYVRDKINPRDTWIQRHLGVMSRTFVSYVSDICSAQQRKDRLGIKMSRRYKDISEV
jgi:hypothetical protein